MATLGLLLMAPPAFAEEPEGFGNNLAMPVIWAEDTPISTLRMGVASQEESLKGESVVVDQETIFLQQDEFNLWQAENFGLAASGLADATSGKLPVSYVDWGDNLESKDWSTKQKIRVETRLIQDVSALADATPAVGDTTGTGMTGYSMLQYGTTTGPDEMWGVVATKDSTWIATEQQRTEAFVYTGEACLTIERIDQASTVKWDANTRTWTGKSVVGVCMGDVADGPGGYGAEVTISGGMTYGYVWDPGELSEGQYRMTFSLTPESGVDLVDSTKPYVTVTTDADGGGKKPPGKGEDVATLAAAAEVSDVSGGEPAGNLMVIDPTLNISYIDVGLDYTNALPTRPVNLEAKPGVEQVSLKWDPPVYEGSSKVTEYIVTAGLQGQYVVDAGIREMTITKLPGGTKTLFTVVAVNNEGPGDAASVVATPLSPTTPPTVTPPTDQGQAVTVQVRAVSGGKKLYVNVGPNKGKGYYQFTVQKLSGGHWRTLPKVYKTYGNGETRRLRLAKGTYRVIVLPRYGYEGMTSEVVSLRKATPSVLPAETEQAVTMTTRATSRESKLYVNVDPNMGKGYWQFVVQKLSSGQWRALSKVYKTKANAERRTLNLRKGTYRVIVMPRYGLQGAMSDTVGLRR